MRKQSYPLNINKWLTMKIQLLLMNILIAILPNIALGNPPMSENISSPIAISQTGRFAIEYYSPLSIDKNESLNLTNFIAYQEVSTKKQIIIGAISGEENLSFICKHPIFL